MILVNGKELTYRATATFQYRENYGAHAWDGEGECPQYWKNKGGEYILLADGLTSKMVNDRQFRDTLIAKGMKREEFNDYCEYHFHGIDFELSDAPTYREVVDAYCDWGIDLEEEEKTWVKIEKPVHFCENPHGVCGGDCKECGWYA